MLRKVHNGQKLKIPAGSYNAMIDAAEYYRKQLHDVGQSSHNSALNNNIVLIKNNTGGNINRFSILGIGGSEIDPANENFQNSTAFTGNFPSWANHTNGRFVITTEPIAAGKFGHAYICGISVVLIDVIAETHYCADIIGGNTDNLQSCKLGAAIILYKQAGTGLKWAVIKFGIVPPVLVQRAKVTGFGPTSHSLMVNLYNSSGVEITNGDGSALEVYCLTNNNQLWNPGGFIPCIRQNSDVVIVQMPWWNVDYSRVDQRWYCTTVFQQIGNLLTIDSSGVLNVDLVTCPTGVS